MNLAPVTDLAEVDAVAEDASRTVAADKAGTQSSVATELEVNIPSLAKLNKRRLSREPSAAQTPAISATLSI